MKIAIQDKVYKVTFGATSFVSKNSMRVLRNADSLNVESLTVIAKDVYDALTAISSYLLEKEKQYAKENLQIWVESVELIALIHDLEGDNK